MPRLIFAVMVVQALYWLAIEPFLSARSTLPDTYELSGASFAEVDAIDEATINAAEFRAVDLPYADCCEGGPYRVARIDFTLDEVKDLGVGTRTWADNYRVAVNGQQVYAPGRMELPDITYNGLDREIVFLPATALQKGTNTLEIVMVRDFARFFEQGPPLIADYQPLVAATKHRNFILNEYAMFSLAVGAAFALLALVVALRARDSGLARWTFFLLFAWCLRIATLLSLTAPFEGMWRIVTAFAAVLLIPVAWVNFINHWTGKPWRYLAVASVTGFLVMLAWTVWMFSGDPDADLVVHTWAMRFTALLVIVILARLITHFFTTVETRYLEAAIFILCLTLIGFDLYLYLSEGNSFFNALNSSLPFLIGGLLVSFLVQNVHLFRSMKEYNALLSTQLAEREAEIAASYDERREVERQRALLEERKRIMRDMHDGMGGRLMSLAAQLRGGGGDAAPGREAIAGELVEALDELRLIVDSLDTAGDDLGIALGAFRARMEPKLSAAGVDLEWRVDDEAAECDLSATEILDIYRVLQEACTNTLRHSGADRLCIALSETDALKGELLLEIVDNGKGLAEHREGDVGHGLANMERRVRRLGGELNFEDAKPGLAISITLPLKAPEGARPRA